MELVVVANPFYFTGETFFVNRLFEAGLQIFHLRKEHICRREYAQFISAIDPVYHNRIALHQFHELAADYDIRRIHDPERFRQVGHEVISPAGTIKSTSIHALKDLQTLSSYDYTFFSPVFNSFSKPGYQAVVNADFILRKPVICPKVFALGGIGLENIDYVKKMNFDGAALLGSIWKDPLQAVSIFINIKERCETNDEQN